VKLFGLKNKTRKTISHWYFVLNDGECKEIIRFIARSSKRLSKRADVLRGFC